MAKRDKQKQKEPQKQANPSQHPQKQINPNQTPHKQTVERPGREGQTHEGQRKDTSNQW